MWGSKPEWETAEPPRMWGVTVPPESQPMKMGGWKVSRNEIYELYGSCGLIRTVVDKQEAKQLKQKRKNRSVKNSRYHRLL